MRKDETGNECPETLGEYRKLIVALTGTDNAAVELLDKSITRDGEDEPVIQPDSQMRLLLMPLMMKKRGA